MEYWNNGVLALSVVVMFCPLAERLGVVVAQLGGLFRRKVRFFGGMEVLLHLFYNMFCLVEVLDIQVGVRPAHVVCMAALRTEFPALETIHVRELPAARAPDDEVHGNDVMRVILLKIYR